MRYPDVNVFHCRVGVIDENNDPIYWGPSIAEYETDIDFIYQRAINRRTQVISDFMFRTDALEVSVVLSIFLRHGIPTR